MEHTHTALGRLIPRVGDTMVSNMRRPMLTIEADTSPGVHDTLIASCDPERYRQLGFEGRHDSCHDNFQTALLDLGLPSRPLPGLDRFFRGATWLWAGIFAASAVALAALMVVEPFTVVLILATVITVAGTIAGALASALWFMRVLRRFGLRVSFGRA